MSQVTEYVFPTSFAQRRLWFLDSLQPGSAVYNVPTALQLDGPLDATAFVRAYDAMLERHEILRTVFRLEQGEPVQIVSESPHPQSRLQLMDLTDRSPDEALALARDLGAQEAARPFDLANGPLIRGRLIRVAAERHLLFVTMHHIVTDAWSRGVLYRELAAHYAAQMEGTPADLPALEVQYADYAIWQRDRLSNGRADELVDYWRRQLAPPVAPFELPTDRPRPPIQTFAGAWLAVPVPDEVAAGFLALCRSERVTLFAAAYAAYSALLHRHTGQSDIVVGTPIAGRPGPEVEALIGFFVNSLALRTEVRPVEGFREHLRRSARVAVDAFTHQDIPFEKLVEVLAPERDRSRNPFFQTVLVVNHAGEGGFSLPGIRVTGLRTGDHETAKFDLTVFLIQHDERLALGFEYNTDLFDRDTVRRLGERLVVLIRGAVAHPDTPIERLAILPDAERRLIVETWSGRHTGYRRNATIHELFAEQARRTPNEIAVSWGGNRLSYRELDAKSGRLAAHLRGLGVAPGDCVGLCHERAPGLVVGLLGILKAGGAYVPLDRAYPDARLSYMMAEARIDIVVTDGRRDVPEGPRLVSLPDVLAGPDCEDRAGPAAGVNAESLAYVIFTSGSTGEPKGVAVPHRAVVRLVDQTDFLQIRPGDRVLGFAPISFDASTFEVWAPLLNGATAVVFPPTSPSLAELGRFIEREQVTVAWLTAALFNQMVDAELPRLRGLRALLAGGDVLSVPHVRRVLQELPGVQLINGYGPTENTTFTCCHRITTADLGRGSISIGRPIANTTVYVLDRTSQPVPIGVAGELYTGGDGVALGYLHRPELTAERFVADPFAGGSARLYRTGDQVRWRPDGTLEFLGRLDQQVKIRGFRIEPGEIEAALVAHPDVREAVVVVRPDARGDKRLVAYVVGRAGLPDAAALKAHCAARLPDFMVPATVVGLTALPVTPNGKVDRAALPHPGSAEEPAPAHGTPHTTLEAVMVKLWETLLPGRAIGTRDDFFALGGHSLLAARMVDELERATGLRLPVATLFQGATIEQIATYLFSHGTLRAQPPLVEVQRGAPGVTPFFMVHGDLTGGGFYCRGMAEAAGPEQPLYAIPPVTPETAPTALTIEAMATLHLAAVREVQPRGPYRLGGYCIGGLVAFEMARQLRATGETVELLLLVDASAFNARLRWAARLARLVGTLTERDPVARLDRAAYLMRRVSIARHLSWAQRGTYLLGAPIGVLKRRAQRLAARLRPSRKGVPDPRAAVSSALRRNQFQHTRAMFLYLPRRYDGPIDLVVTTMDRGPRDDRSWTWTAVSRRVNTIELECDHTAVVMHHLPGLFRDLLQRLDAGERR